MRERFVPLSCASTRCAACVRRLTPGNVIDFSWIEADLNDLSTRFEVQAVAFDPFQATQPMCWGRPLPQPVSLAGRQAL